MVIIKSGSTTLFSCCALSCKAAVSSSLSCWHWLRTTATTLLHRIHTVDSQTDHERIGETWGQCIKHRTSMKNHKRNVALRLLHGAAFFNSSGGTRGILLLSNSCRLQLPKTGSSAIVEINTHVFWYMLEAWLQILFGAWRSPDSADWNLEAHMQNNWRR